MLQENKDVISFFPGSVNGGGEIILGRIVVHDRLKVEANVLPRYFNHSSFASLRRQLNYFSFTRLGKGRQRGATYCNEAVIEIDDILRLKRRSNTGTTGAPTTAPSLSAEATSESSSSIERSNFKRSRSVSVTSLEEQDTTTMTQTISRPTKKHRPLVVTTEVPQKAVVHHMVSDGEQESNQQQQSRITLDLTVPPIGDAEILAGCRALLSIANHRNIGLNNQCC